MPSIWNLSPQDVIGHVGGVPYRFPPSQKVTIREQKVFHPDLGYEEYISPEIIANKLFADLQGRGVVLVPDEDPLSSEMYMEMSREAQIKFIENALEDFRQQNIERATQGKKIMRVPQHYKQMRDYLLTLRKDQDEEDDGPGFTPRAELEAMRPQNQKDQAKEQTMKDLMVAAAETGSTEAVIEAAERAEAAKDFRLGGDDLGKPAKRK